MAQDFLLSLPRGAKKILFLIHDSLIIFITFWFSLSLKPEYNDEWQTMSNWLIFGITAILTIVSFIRLGLYRAVTRYIGSKVLTTTLSGSLISVAVLLICMLVIKNDFSLIVPVVYFLILLVLFFFAV